MRLRAACIQFAPRKAQMAANLDRISDLVRQAVGAGVRLAVFPEGSVAGYFLEGGVLECSFSRESLEAEFAARLTGLAAPIDFAVGFYEADGNDLHNSVAYVEARPDAVRVTHIYRKFFLPTYGVFDEERYVSPGRELCVFDAEFGRVGLLICEDVWHSIMPTLVAVAGADLLLVPSASPARGFHGAVPDNLERYGRLLQGIAEEHGMFVMNSMLCGFEGGKGFAGGSAIFDPYGSRLSQGPLHDEHILVADMDLDQIQIARAQSPLIGDLRAAWSDIARLAEDLEA